MHLIGRVQELVTDGGTRMTNDNDHLSSYLSVEPINARVEPALIYETIQLN